MRDRLGVERGRCANCSSQGVECCELVLRVPGHDDFDFNDAFEAADPEDYSRDPVIACIRARIDARLLCKEITARDADFNGVCSLCGCAPESHEVVVLSAEEDRNLTILRRLYAPIDMQDCVCQSTRDTLSLGFTRDNFTYGEVGNLSFLRLLDSLATTCGPGGIFYDLGCGVGKAVVLAALHSIRFAKCIGVEMLPGLCAIARGLGLHVRDEVLLDDAASSRRSYSTVEFIQGDLLKMELSDATVVLVNIGNWEEPNLSHLRNHFLQRLPHGCKVITIRKQLSLVGCTDLVNLEELWLPMSWGLAPVFVAERRRKDSANVISLDALD